MQWITWIWFFGFLSFIVGVLIDPTPTRKLQADYDLSFYSTGAVVLVVSALWFVLVLLDLAVAFFVFLSNMQKEKENEHDRKVQ